jgi:hypothetical protein
MHRIMRIVLSSSLAFCCVISANTSEAGLFDWMWGPRPVQYAPSTVGYYPSGAYYNAGPAATHYTTNYAPYSQGLFSPATGAYPTARATAYYAPYSAYRVPAAGRPTTTFYRAPRTTYYRSPTTTFYRGTPGYPTVTNYPPSTVAYYPSTPPRQSFFGRLFNWQNACGGLTPCRPYASTTTNYQPRTSYRPVWQRVPVTYFRPVSQVDPVTGQLVQQMQPCTTYRWQVQQRSTLLPRRAPAMPIDPWCDPAAVPAARESRPSTDPYYDRSRIIRPGERRPADGLIPRDAEVIREETLEPSERRPRLEGAPPEPNSMGSVRRPGFDRVSSTPRASTRGDSTTESARSQRESDPARSSLIPDPDEDRDGYPEAPKLMKPRDRTASFSAPRVRRIAYQAVWPEAKKPSVTRVQRDSTVSQPVERRPVRRHPTRKLDDSGWRTIH